MTAPLRTAILGASGYIGQHFARLLADHPTFDMPMLGGGDRSVGKTLADVWLLSEPVPAALAERRIERLPPGRLARGGVRAAFSALPSGTAAAVETELVRRGVSVFSNAADHRMDPGVPLLVPEVNRAHLRLLTPRPSGRGAIITNPNCSATGLVVALAPIVPLLRPRAVHVATYQSISGAGYPGVPSLAITDNVVPFIRDEEEKMALETGKILGRLSRRSIRPAPFPLVAHCVRVGTREGHLEAVTIEATTSPRRSEIEAAWRSFDPLRGVALPTAPHPPIELRAEADRPQPIRDRWAGAPARARGMAVVIGRVRWSPPFLRFFVLSHNAVRGGAGGSVLNAELALADGVLGRSAA